MRTLIESGRMPFLLADVLEWRVIPQTRELMMTVQITNAATSAALETSVSVYPRNSAEPYNDKIVFLQPLLGGNQATLEFTIPLSVAEYRKRNPVFMLECAYSTIDGHYVADWIYLEFSWQVRPKTYPPVMAMHRRKIYHHSNSLEIDVAERYGE
jgi:hypothetical protein